MILREVTLPPFFVAGYKAIGIEDIDSLSELRENQKITAIGFPADHFKVASRNLAPANRPWESDIISIPVLSEGSIGDPTHGKNYFEGRIFVEHGNSGGPIVSSDKLVGTVSTTAAPLQKLNSPQLNACKKSELHLIKSSLIRPLLEDLYQRGKNRWVK